MGEIDDFVEDFEHIVFTESTRIKRMGKRKNKEINGEMHRYCFKCEKWKPLSEYHRRKPHDWTTKKEEYMRQAHCKKCASAKGKKRK